MVLPLAYGILGIGLVLLGLWVGNTAHEQIRDLMEQDWRAALLVAGPILLGTACLVLAARAFLGKEGPTSRSAERAAERRQGHPDSRRHEVYDRRPAPRYWWERVALPVLDLFRRGKDDKPRRRPGKTY